VQEINKAPAPRIVAFRKDGSALDTVTVMLMMSWAQICIQHHDMIRLKSALSSEVDKRISRQHVQNSGPEAKTFNLRCLVPQKSEQVIEKVLDIVS
jgi:hypothetical protein